MASHEETAKAILAGKKAYHDVRTEGTESYDTEYEKIRELREKTIKNSAQTGSKSAFARDMYKEGEQIQITTSEIQHGLTHNFSEDKLLEPFAVVMSANGESKECIHDRQADCIRNGTHCWNCLWKQSSSGITSYCNPHSVTGAKGCGKAARPPYLQALMEARFIVLTKAAAHGEYKIKTRAALKAIGVDKDDTLDKLKES